MYLLYIGSFFNKAFPMARFTSIVTSQVFVKIWMQWSIALGFLSAKRMRKRLLGTFSKRKSSGQSLLSANVLLNITSQVSIFLKIAQCWFQVLSVFYAPLKKGGILFCNCRSVGRSVGQSVDHVLSAQYLLTPSLDQYQTRCRGCPQWVDDPYWFSRSHVQRSRSNHSSQPMVLSAQYLLTLSIDQYQT